MARNKGTFTFAANFQVKAAEALDPRVVVENKAELIDKETWPYDGSTLYLYNGLIVAVAAEKQLYMLVDKTKALKPDYSGWKQIDAGGASVVEVIDNLTTNDGTKALSAKQGYLLNNRLTAVEGKVTSIFTFKGTKASVSELPEEDNTTGDVWIVSEDGSEHVWTGSAWEELGVTVNLEGYATTEYVEGEISSLDTAYKAADTALDGRIDTLTTTVNKKVDKVEGSSLIPSDKLALIDTNASGIEEINTNLASYKVKDVNTTAASGVSLSLSDSKVGVSVELDTLATALTGNANMSGNQLKIGKAISQGATISATDTIATAIEKLGSAIGTAVSGGITNIGSSDNSISVTGEGNTRDVKVNIANLIKTSTNLSAADGKLDLVWIEAE